jgi:hypothetical protein
MNHHDADTLARFERRFAGIEAEVKDPPPSSRGRATMSRSSRTPRSLVVPIAVVAAVIAVVTLGSLLTGDRSIGPGSDPSAAGEAASPSPGASPSLSPTAVSTVMIGEWTSRCVDVDLVDCRGASERFLNHLARSGPDVFDWSGGVLTVRPRPVCPPVPVGADGAFCWQVTAERATSSGGSWCMVIAKRSGDLRYPPYVQVGGPIGGLAVGMPTGWPSCR